MSKRTTKAQLEQRLLELGRSEERYRGILDSIDEGYFELDLKGNYTFVNDAVCRMLGYGPDEIIGLNYHRYTSPETARHMLEVFGKIYRSGKPEHLVDYEVIRKDGSVRVHEMNAAPLKDAAGRITGFRGLGRDVTPRKRAEEELRKSEERYRGILDNMEEAYYEVDLQGNFTFFNTRAVNRLGYTIEELSGMNYRQYMNKENAEKVFNAYHRVFLTGEPITGLEWELADKDGRNMFVEASVSLRRDARGTPTGFMGVVRDVTERKLAEEALRESEAKYRFLTEKINDVVWTMDLNLHTTYVSPSVTKVLGYTPEERLIQEPQDQMTPETYARAVQSLAYELERDGQPGLDPDRTITFEAEYYHKDGSRVWMENRITGIRDEQGRPVGLHGVSRDINERKRAAEALRESEERFKDLARLLPETVFETDLNGRFTFVNQISLERFRFTEEDVQRGVSILDVMAPEEHERVIMNYQ
ncbi:MAG: PAS domain S-box protein, partial [Desulfobacterota bacterium]|nr:PAS domain S-box protein [Thermodesulfobacteriota bacterium]